MNASEFIARARSTLGLGVPYDHEHKTAYDPTFDPASAVPPNVGLDCSTFVRWAGKLSYYLDTAGIVQDATGAKRHYEKISAPKPGCLIVYPDYNSVPVSGVTHPAPRHDGHVGIVTEIRVVNSVPTATQVIHCSSLVEAMRAELTGVAGDGIMEGGPLWFPVFKPIFVWCHDITDDPVQAANRD